MADPDRSEPAQPATSDSSDANGANGANDANDANDAASSTEPARSAAAERAASAASPPHAPTKQPARPATLRVALAIYAFCVVVYALFAGERLATHSPDNHFSYLADSYLHGTLAVRCEPAEVARRACPPGGGGNDWARYEGRWYVAFPSFPAVVYMPAVALFGRDFRNRWLDVAVAGLAPALLYALLEKLSRRGRSARTWRENLAFAALFAFGTVFFYCAVQGSVWFTAHVVSASLLVGYLWFALDAERPLLAGLMLALALHTRASLVYLAPWFALEALRVHRPRSATGEAAPTAPPDGSTLERLRAYLLATDVRALVRSLALFALPVALGVALTLYLNKLRFDDPFEVGYRYLQIGWRGRIERWGLFNYHYLSRNLAVALTSLPWFTRELPYVMISLHGVALWVTTPHYLELLRLRARPGHGHTVFLAVSAAVVALADLLYQNSGWVQFGYRFSNDYAVLLVVLLALNGRRVRAGWLALLAVAIAVNAFGAVTFDRTMQWQGRRVNFYDNDYSQQRYFQPD